MPTIQLIAITLFILIHLIPLNEKFRTKLIDRFGISTYKIFFSLISGSSFALAFSFARLNEGIELYSINEWAFQHIHSFMPIVSILIVLAYLPSGYLKCYLKHPMLIGLIIWSSFHALINPNLYHATFFIGMMIFCLIMLFGLLRKEWPIKNERPKLSNLKYDLLGVILGGAMHGIIVKMHFLLAGVQL